MRARTLGNISAGPLAARKGNTSYLLLWPSTCLGWFTHLPSSLSPREYLRFNKKVWLELWPPPASRSTPSLLLQQCWQAVMPPHLSPSLHLWITSLLHAFISRAPVYAQK